MRHDDVAGLIHEFGHVLEFGLARTDGAMITESWTEIDFVEAPSQIMEHWAWSPAVVQRLGRHHATGAPPPDELVAGLPAARQLNVGTQTLCTSSSSGPFVDQYLHGPEPVDATDAYRRAYAVTGFPFMEGTFQPGTFDHITGIYDAGFYSYIWAQVFGDDMFSAFLDGGLLSPEVGARYRREVLEPSWGVPGPAAGRELPWPAAVGSGVPGAAAARDRRRVGGSPTARGPSPRAGSPRPAENVGLVDDERQPVATAASTRARARRRGHSGTASPACR